MHPIQINTVVMNLVDHDEFCEIEVQSNQYLWRNGSEISINNICNRNSGATGLLLEREIRERLFLALCLAVEGLSF